MTEEQAESFLREIGAPLRPSPDGPYKPIDQFRDFYAVFGTEQGKRVLRQIIDRCEEPMPHVNSTLAEYVSHVARRRLGIWIMGLTVGPLNARSIQFIDPPA